MEKQLQEKLHELTMSLKKELNNLLGDSLPEGKSIHVKEINLLISDMDHDQFMHEQITDVANKTKEGLWGNGFENNFIGCTNPKVKPGGILVCPR